MYAFKVFVSTLIVGMIAVIFYAGFKGDKSAKMTSSIMAIVFALAIIAIWG